VTPGDGPLDVLEPHETVTIGPGGVEGERQHGVDRIERRHVQSRHGERPPSLQHPAGIEGVGPAVLGGVVEVPVEVDAHVPAGHPDLAGHHRFGQRPVVDGVGVAVLLEQLHGGRVVLTGDEEVEVAIGPIADVGVERGHDGTLHHQPRQPGVVERRGELAEGADDEEVVDGRLLPGPPQRGEGLGRHRIGDPVEAAQHGAADSVQRRRGRQGAGRR
jgi:hypothetical protein